MPTPNTNLLSATPVLTVAASYVSGDYVGTSGVAMVFNGATFRPNRTGTVYFAEIIDLAAQAAAGELWLFNTAVTPPADSAAWTVSDGDVASCLGVIPFATTDYYSSAVNSIGQKACSVGILTVAASTTIYGCFVTRGTPSYASGDLTFNLSVWQD